MDWLDFVNHGGPVRRLLFLHVVSFLTASALLPFDQLPGPISNSGKQKHFATVL
jgi:hypothetical protein